MNQQKQIRQALATIITILALTSLLPSSIQAHAQVTRVLSVEAVGSAHAKTEMSVADIAADTPSIIGFYNSSDSPTFIATPVIPEQLVAPIVNNIVNWPGYDSEFLITWSAVENVNQYELEVWSEETDWELVSIVQAVEYQVSNQPLGHWCFRVRSIRADALPSSWSNNVCTDVNELLPSTPTSMPTNTPILTPIPPTETPIVTIEPTIAPTATAIPPLPTATVVPTEIPTQAPTETPVPTTTPTLTPTQTEVPTEIPTQTPTNTNRPTLTAVPNIELTTPVLFEIDNGPDFDDYYELEWTAMPNAALFAIEEWSGQSGWRSIGSITQNRYEVRGQDLGYWCYRVQAQRESEFSDWSVVRCTTVSSRQQSPTSTSISPVTSPTVASPTVTSSTTSTPESVATSTPTVAQTTATPTSVPTSESTATSTATATPTVTPEETATTTPIKPPTPSSNETDPTIPNLETVFDAEQIANGNYTVQWSTVGDEMGDEAGYELQVWASRNGWVTILAGTFTYFDAQGYSAGTWCYRVRANSLDGSTQWSNVDCANIMPVITISTHSSDPIGQAVEMSVTVAKTNIPLLQWPGEVGSKYHIWKSTDGSIENATRLTIDQMEARANYSLDDISELAYIHKTGERSASTYWLVERRGASTIIHGPFTAVQVEPENRLYFPLVNQ